MKKELLKTFEYDSNNYDESFRLFLQHTDQKRQANIRLDELVKALPNRRTFIDVGAGEGTVTARLKHSFARTIAIEPNPKLSETLRVIPGIEVLEMKMEDLKNIPKSDLVLSSHVFYLLDHKTWIPSIEVMSSWLSDTGSLVIINQNKDTDCRIMYDFFYGERFDLSTYLPEITAIAAKMNLTARVETVSSHIDAPSLEVGFRISEFLLSGNSSNPIPLANDVRDYLARNHTSADGQVRLSCDQDFLIISH